jgi:signal transduction histidine kinase
MAVALAEMPDGSILCATRSEIWEFNGKKNWLLLQDGFNHINGLAQSRDGSIWVASNGGLFRFYKDTWLDNGTEEGLPGGPVHAICEDAQGQTWVATAHGVSLFHPDADLDPPQTSIRRLAGEGGQLSEGSSLSLLLEGRDKWKITSPDRLLYSYQLDQSGWSPFRNISTPTFSYLAAGRHYFQVRAMDPAGNLETTPATLDFMVTVPWFKEGRLWVVLVFGLALAIFFAAVAWNRHRQLVLSHAAVEKKVAERTRELEIATRELLHSQKMNALGTLAAGIAHDFNNILSIIKGSAQIIEDNPSQPEKIRTRVDRIKTVVQQGAEIVDAMLGFSRGSNALPAPCDVNVVVTDTMKLLGDRFLREVEVKFERGQKLPEIVAPREFIQQILLNFIFNAAEAMNGRKEIILATNLADKLPSDIFLAPASSASFVLVSVRDIGSGIAPEIVSRIFEPFFTTKAFSARRGTGLGLSMVYELAKKMDAGLSVQSVVGHGSTFTLILPVSNHNGAKPTPETLS